VRRAPATIAVTGVVLLSAYGGARWWALTSLPPPGGVEPVRGLGAVVSVLVDSLAVPHIVAARERDAYTALGYVHARDRMFQMDLLRHAAEGRLSELFGERAVAADRTLREFEMGRIARARLAGLSVESRRMAEAYARGVNAWLATDQRALEFRILGHVPERWEPVHSLGIGVLQARDLAFSGDELNLAAVAARLGEEKARTLIPAYADTAPIIVSQGLSWRGAGVEAEPPAASNSVVLAGSRTESGRPILANDPHLTLRSPALWYLAGLHTPGMDVVGGTIPGIPAVVLGHTRYVAWGFTNAMVDDMDYVLEELSADSSRYRTARGWAPIEVVAETIVVKGAAPVVYTRRRTANGPLVTVEPRPDSTFAVARRWTAQDGGRDELATLHRWARARSAAELVAAGATFRSPEQNVVYADAAGNIGYLLLGAVPVRRSGAGVFPVAGAGGPVWTRYLTAVELPADTNPASGRIVTANNRIVGPDYPFHLTYQYDHPYRAQRLLQLVGGAEGLTAADVARAQLDQVDLFARSAKRLVAQAALDTRRPDLADRFRGWDGTMSPDLIEPTIFWIWYRALQRLTYADESPEYQPALPLHRWLLQGGGGWFDDVRTPRRERLRDIARMALDSAIAEAPFPRWGAVHETVMEHPLGDVPVLGRLVEFTVGPLPAGGSNYTLNVALSTRQRPPFTSGYGPSLRHVVDLGRPDEAGGFVIPTGQSGHPLSPHYRDQTERWRRGALWIIPVDPRRVVARDTLRLVPGTQ